jgi:hypothetical protein
MKDGLPVNVTVEIHCDKCGSEDITIPKPDRRLDSIVCNTCGADNGTLAALEQSVEQDMAKQLGDEFAAILANAFDGISNVKVTKG